MSNPASALCLQTVDKHEWVGRGEDGFPVMEGKVNEILGKNLEIW